MYCLFYSLAYKEPSGESVGAIALCRQPYPHLQQIPTKSRFSGRQGVAPTG